MSQSDLIRYKKVSNQLLEMKKLDSVLSSQDYITFKQYTLESKNNNITNTTKPILNQLTLPGNNRIFSIEKNFAKCSSNTNFTMCNKTDKRGNRRYNTINIPNQLNQHPEKQII